MKRLPRISGISPAGPGRTRVVFESGATRVIEWSRYARPGTLLERLADPAFAARCRIVDHGYGLQWPGGLDWASEAVLAAGYPVHEPVGGPLFRARGNRQDPDSARRNGSPAVASNGHVSVKRGASTSRAE